MKLVIATKNTGKIREIKNKFHSIPGIEVLSLSDFGEIPDVVEDGLTFAENALKKARAVADFTGCAALADDSGLVIDALNGEPGIRSARYAGDGADDNERNMLVLAKMSDVQDGKRTARFVCAIAIVLPDGHEYVTEGTCEGTITREMRGDHGFGYDPIFFLSEFGRTMAEIPLEDKNRISHRARALDAACAILLSIRR